MKNLWLGALMGAPSVHNFCRGGLVLRRRASRLRTGHSMMVV
jgi:hypothetical protein